MMRILAATVVAAVTAAAVCAQAPALPAERELSLAQAVALAWEQSPRLEGRRAEVPAARARAALMRSGGRLVASTTTFLTGGSMSNLVQGVEPVQPRPPVVAPPEAQADQNLMVMYPLSTGGRVSAEVAGAEAELRAAQAGVDSALLEVVYRVREAYWRVLLNQEMVKIAQENLKEQQERLRVDQEMYDVGKIPLYYVLRDKAEVAEAQQALTNAERDVDTALLRLREEIGIEMGERVVLTDALVYEADRPGEPAALAEQAVRTHPAMRVAEARVEAARRQVAVKQAAFRPQVAAALMADAFRNLSGNDSALRGGYTAGIIASLPLLDGGSRRAEADEAWAQVRRAEADRATLRLEITREVHEAWLDFNAADRNVSTAEQALAAADEDYRVATERYQAGKAINLEPISALAALVRARTNLVQALFEQRTALDRLNRAVGRLPQGALQGGD